MGSPGLQPLPELRTLAAGWGSPETRREQSRGRRGEGSAATGTGTSRSAQVGDLGSLPSRRWWRRCRLCRRLRRRGEVGFRGGMAARAGAGAPFYVTDVEGEWARSGAVSRGTDAEIHGGGDDRWSPPVSGRGERESGWAGCGLLLTAVGLGPTRVSCCYFFFVQIGRASCRERVCLYV